MDSAKRAVIIDGVEYTPMEPEVVEYTLEKPVEPHVEPENASVDAPVGNTEPWYAFIKAVRFWVMILGALSIYGESKGWIGEPERNLIATVSAIFITVSTIDRGAEKMSGN